jgi:hypothetical protein
MCLQPDVAGCTQPLQLVCTQPLQHVSFSAMQLVSTAGRMYRYARGPATAEWLGQVANVRTLSSTSVLVADMRTTT